MGSADNDLPNTIRNAAHDTNAHPFSSSPLLLSHRLFSILLYSALLFPALTLLYSALCPIGRNMPTGLEYLVSCCSTSG